jgi:hypothetical protein
VLLCPGSDSFPEKHRIRCYLDRFRKGFFVMRGDNPPPPSPVAEMPVRVSRAKELLARAERLAA